MNNEMTFCHDGVFTEGVLSWGCFDPNSRCTSGGAGAIASSRWVVRGNETRGAHWATGRATDRSAQNARLLIVVRRRRHMAGGAVFAPLALGPGQRSLLHAAAVAVTTPT